MNSDIHFIKFGETLVKSRRVFLFKWSWCRKIENRHRNEQKKILQKPNYKVFNLSSITAIYCSVVRLCWPNITWKY